MNTKTIEFKKIIEDNLLFNAISRTKIDIKRWRHSLISAENWYNPIRLGLYTVYKEIMDDLHLKSSVEKRIRGLQRLEFDIVMNVNGVKKIKREYNYIFESKWFKDMQRYFIESIFYGHSLIHIEKIVNNVPTIYLIDREFVSPERGLILKYPTTLDGYDYRAKSRENMFFMEIGENRELGLLAAISPYVIWKRSTLQFWARLLEKFGIPFLKGTTTDIDNMDKFAKSLIDVGSDGVIMLSNGDTVEVLDAPIPAGVDYYTKFTELINGEVSKVILGAAGVSDGLQSGTQTQSTVHQEQYFEILQTDIENFEYFCNSYMIKVLSNLGAIPSNIEIEFRNPNKVNEQLERAEFNLKISELVDKGYWDMDYLKDTFDFIPTKAFETNYRKTNNDSKTDNDDE